MRMNRKKIRQDLIDLYYSGADMSFELSEHLKTCSDCADFWKGMAAVGEAIPELEPAEEADEGILRNAFREAESVLRKQKNTKDFISFMILAFAFAATLFVLASRGYGLYLLTMQLLFILIAPFTVPFIIKRRLTKEDC